MKSYAAIVLVVLCSTALCDRQSELMENAKNCAQKYNVSIEDANKAINGDIKPSDITPAQKCIFLCMAEKDGIMKDGNFLTQVLSEKLANSPNKDAVLKGIAACKDIKGTDNCDTSFKVMTCLTLNKAI